MRRRFLTGKVIEGRNIPDISWHGIRVNKPLWNDAEARLLAFTLAGTEAREADLHIVMNMSGQQEIVELPILKGKRWCIALDTSLPSPQDIVLPEQQKPLTRQNYLIHPQSVVVLENMDFKF
jgi:glycogen operon protein